MLKKVTKEDIPQIADPIMQSLLQMLHNSTTNQQQQSGGGDGAVSGVQEDAILAITALVEKLGPGFVQYMPSFSPYLIQTLKNTAEYQVRSSVSVSSDFCRFYAVDFITLSLIAPKDQFTT